MRLEPHVGHVWLLLYIRLWFHPLWSSSPPSLSPQALLLASTSGQASVSPGCV